jgi:hypothetical protein
VRDDLPAGTAEFRQRMQRLRAECDNPTQAQMRQAIATFNVDKLARATLSEFLNDVRAHSLPKWEFVRSYVAACLLHRGTAPHTVSEELQTWATWWTSLVTADDKSALSVAPAMGNGQVQHQLTTTIETTDSAPDSATNADAGDTEDAEDAARGGEPAAPTPARRRLRTVLVIAVSAVVGFGAGVVVAGTWWPSSSGPDPSLAYGICAEAIEPATRVGHIALLADTGPHGTPVQDRLIELRVQEHPDRGWIAWAYLARTPSNLDRLWLDWSYLQEPGSDQSNYRQCGAQPVTEGRGTPGILVTDNADRPRWFRACGQVPTEDRAPDHAGTFCTSWTRPRVS